MLTALRLLGILLLLSLLSACGSETKPPTTRIDPATVSLSRHVQGQDATETRITVKAPPPLPVPPAPPSAYASSAAPVGSATSPTEFTAPVPPAAAGIHIEADGKIVTAPAGSTVDIATGTPAKTDVASSAYAAGNTVRTDGDAGKMTQSPPEVSWGPETTTGAGGVSTKGGKAVATGGDLGFSWETVSKALGAAGRGEWAMWLIGLGFILVTIGYVGFELWAKQAPSRPLIEVGLGAGVGFILLAFVLEKAPGVVVTLAVLGILGALAYVVWKWKQEEDAKKAADAAKAKATAAAGNAALNLSVPSTP